MENVNGGQCSSCGNDVGMISLEKRQDQNQDKGFGVCPTCEEEIKAHQEGVWDTWRAQLRATLKPDRQAKWDSLGVDGQKNLILEQMKDGNIKISTN